jgi:hypothetical protein
LGGQYLIDGGHQNGMSSLSSSSASGSSG